MKLKLTTPTSSGFLSGNAVNVSLDGVDVSRYVNNVVVVADAEGAIRAEVTFYLTGVDVDLPVVIEPLVKQATEAGVMGRYPLQHRRRSVGT